MNKYDNRIIQFDLMKVIAAFAVIWLHASAESFYTIFPSYEWGVRNIYDSMVRWCVPIFIMVSGALFLENKKKIGKKQLYTKYIVRVVLIFFFWSIVYAVYDGFGRKGLVGMIGRIIIGPSHFWYLKMLIGLYISIPILKKIVENREVEKYFLSIMVVACFLIPMFFPIVGLVNETCMIISERYYDELGIKLVSGYVCYFILGHYLYTIHVFKKSFLNIIYSLGFLSIVAVIALTYYASYCKGEIIQDFYDYNNLFTFFEATAIFCFLRQRQVRAKYYKYIVNASKYSFGIYIIHPFVMLILNDSFGFNSSSLPLEFFIPIYVSIIFFLCYFIISIAIKIPILNRFLM